MIARAGRCRHVSEMAFTRGELDGLRPSRRRQGFKAWWVELHLFGWYVGVYR